MDSTLYDAENVMEGFQLYRADPDRRKKGGVGLYLSAGIVAETQQLSKGSKGYLGHLMLHIEKYNLLVANVYNPQGLIQIDLLQL